MVYNGKSLASEAPCANSNSTEIEVPGDRSGGKVLRDANSVPP